MNSETKRITTPAIRAQKASRLPDARRIAALTAYDFTIARPLDRAGVDIILVGDSLGMVVQGEPTTLTGTR